LEQIPLYAQLFLLIVLILCSAFFSGAETSMMSLNKHRLKHLSDEGNPGAKRALSLLTRPDRLLGVILLGNNFINILAASLATLIGIRLWGDAGIFIMTIIMTIVVLIFGEVTPKTFAALHAEKIAFPASVILKVLLKVLYPIVWLTNAVAAIVLKPLGVSDFNHHEAAVSKEELRSILSQESTHIDEENQGMMLGVLYLEDIKVEDIMVARHELIGLNLQAHWQTSVDSILNSQHARLLIYDDSIDEVKGILHIRDVLSLYRDNRPLTKDNILTLIHKPYFIPKGTPLRTQLQLFQAQKRQTSLVVDEYGEIIGLLTLEDILEYIVGDLGLQEIAEENENAEEFIEHDDASIEVRGNLSINYLNKEFDWHLPYDGPKTLNGLILEQLGQFPKQGTQVTIDGYQMTVLSFDNNRIKRVLINLPKTEK